MSQSTRIQYAHTSPFAKKAISKRIAHIKSLLNNETVQKVILFTTILGLLLVAANLDNIM